MPAVETTIAVEAQVFAEVVTVFAQAVVRLLVFGMLAFAISNRRLINVACMRYCIA
jgi:hypothetical protein